MILVEVWGKLLILLSSLEFFISQKYFLLRPRSVKDPFLSITGPLGSVEVLLVYVWWSDYGHLVVLTGPFTDFPVVCTSPFTDFLVLCTGPFTDFLVVRTGPFTDFRVVCTGPFTDLLVYFTAISMHDA